MRYYNYKKRKFNKKILYIFLILFTLLSILIPITIAFLLLPKEINLIAGNKHKIDLNLPVIAKIDENASVFNVNDKPLEQNQNINLNKPVYIQSDYEGSHNMTLSVMGIPVKSVKVSVLPNQEVIPCGISIGVRINTDGVMVLGLGSVKSIDKKEYSPAENILKPGDMILEINGIPIDSKETLTSTIQKNDNLNIKIRRKEEEMTVNITPVKAEDNKNKIGAWVRDSTQGIGTLTYYNSETKDFGALGHGIVDVDTKEIMKVKDGKIMKAEIIGTKKSEKGSPGELLGEIKNKNKIGNISLNTDVGIYGKITDENFLADKAIPVGFKDEVEIGSAKILSNINGTDVEEFDIEITNINKYNMDSSKSMVIKITDEKLLNKTNGIVQGMSGGPIIQNGKIIGAVTHVFINEPSKGYGIFIENMLKNQ